MNIKIKIAVAATAVTLGAFALASLVGAQTTALSITCHGAVTAAGTTTSTITWTASPAGGNEPYAIHWSNDAAIAGATSTTVAGTYTANGTYTADVQVTDASSTVATSTCSANITSIVPPAPTSTPPRPFMNKPMLSINGAGRFLGRGMKVMGVGTNSFQAEVWGITYTINWSGDLSPFAFLFRDGRAATSTPAAQLQIGDEVGVSGQIDPSSPLVVNADVVRDYSITVPRAFHSDNGKGNEGEDNGQGHGFGVSNQGEDKNETTSSNSGADLQNRFQGLFKQFQDLQNLFRGRFGH